MALTNKDMKRFLVAFIILSLLALSFLIIKPILISIITGLILAYIFMPLFKKVLKYFKNKNLSAFTSSFLIILIVLASLWFLVPLAIQQTVDLFEVTQNIDFREFVNTVFPTSTDSFQRETAAMIFRFIGDLTTSAVNGLIGFILNLPTVLLNLAVIIFVFFFTLRDSDILKEFVSGISPFRKEKEKALVQRFKEITSSIIYGYIIIGIIQGIALGVGLLLFKVPRPLTLTLMAIFASILPMLGPWLIWVPVVLYFIATGNVLSAIGFAIYGGLFVSLIDNFLRPYIVARKTGTSSVIVLIGMIGGLLVFGILGIILGPLILSYLTIFLRAYKDRTLSDMFSPE